MDDLKLVVWGFFGDEKEQLKLKTVNQDKYLPNIPLFNKPKHPIHKETHFQMAIKGR